MIYYKVPKPKEREYPTGTIKHISSVEYSPIEDPTEEEFRKAFNYDDEHKNLKHGEYLDAFCARADNGNNVMWLMVRK